MEFRSLTEHKNILLTLLQHNRDLLSKVENHELKQFDITVRQLSILDLVEIIGQKATPKEISLRLLRQPHSISSLLLRMEKQGLINRDVDPDKRTNLNITLTDKGRKILDESRKMTGLNEVTACLSEEELHQLIQLLMKLRDSALNKITKINSPLFP